MVLSFTSIAQAGYANAVAALLTILIVLCAVWGLIRREHVFGRSLSNWDEAAAYACLASLAFMLAQ